MPAIRRTSRSTRAKASLAPLTKFPGPPAIVPPMDYYRDKLRWATELRSVDPNTLVPQPVSSSMTADVSRAKSQKRRAFCDLCQKHVNGDRKTIQRHCLSEAHVKQVALILNIDPDTFRPRRLPCEWCGEGIAGERDDSLSRHRSVCKRSPRIRSTSVKLQRSASLPLAHEREVSRKGWKQSKISRSASLPVQITTSPSSPASPSSSISCLDNDNLLSEDLLYPNDFDSRVSSLSQHASLQLNPTSAPIQPQYSIGFKAEMGTATQVYWCSPLSHIIQDCQPAFSEFTDPLAYLDCASGYDNLGITDAYYTMPANAADFDWLLSADSLFM
ncbi:hypothetical protein NM688_g394 [Phlebia brevispora]|uniref:Uncharacterized protein n=1 Tax=Phlebia brevispora TaxID=194682 RepID=A0ACC1TEP3_9APHY|nr:hypothetical protein NM688_g394 [Phlebia brevispora]